MFRVALLIVVAFAFSAAGCSKAPPVPPAAAPMPAVAPRVETYAEAIAVLESEKKTLLELHTTSARVERDMENYIGGVVVSGREAPKMVNGKYADPAMQLLFDEYVATGVNIQVQLDRIKIAMERKEAAALREGR